jgi:predicted DCC family thiol-disulfide oxidoreductase YuxK
MLGGSTSFQAALFLLAGVLALLLIVGYRTRLVSILCWLMLVSLDQRNHLILQTSDTLMLTLLFWSLFLPLGARYSIDAALNREPIETSRVCSPASAALVLQVLYVYFFGALLKVGDSWMFTGDAVHVALHFSHYASPLGSWVGEVMPPSVLRGLTHYTWYIELYGPILVLSPFYTARIRAVIVPGLMLLHVGFALFLAVGIYPYLSLTSLLLLIPGEFWERRRTRLATPERRGLIVYYDGSCVFCHKVCLLLRTFLLLDSTPIRPAQDDPVVHELMQVHHSWVVEDYDGKRYVRWAAMLVLLRRSWLLAPLTGLLGTAPLRALGERFYDWVADNRESLGRITAVLLPWRAIGIGQPLLVHGLVLGFLLMVLLNNLSRLPQVSIDNPGIFQRITNALLLNQYWTMFAPEPGRTTQWLFVEGQLADGRKVDLYGESFTPPLVEKPADGSGYFHGYRWRKYYNQANLLTDWPRLASYYCHRWNADHPDTRAVTASGYVLQEHTRVGIYQGDMQWERSLQPLGVMPCS